MKVKLLSHVQLLATPWTAAYQAPPSMGFFQARVLEWAAIAFSPPKLPSYPSSRHFPLCVCLVTQSCPTLFKHMADQSSVHGDSPGQNTGVGCYVLLQGCPTQGSNPGLLHCRWILYQLSYQGSPSLPHRLFKSAFSG